MQTVIRLHDVLVLRAAPQGPPLDGEAAALDLISEAYTHNVDVVAVPVERCSEAFFQLATGVAGAVAQKFVNYHYRLAIVGDISHHIARSDAFRDFVRETNRRGPIWFVASDEELAGRLAPTRAVAGTFD